MDEQKNKIIGGFHGLELAADLPPERSAWQHMTSDAIQLLTYVNARSALFHILQSHRPTTTWYPAYYCGDAVVRLNNGPVCYYPVGSRLEPDPDWLDRHVKAGDAVIGVDYFGISPSNNFCAYVESRPDILWIEDRAQAINPSRTWGDWQIYSPRKLFGVPDGGIARCLNPQKTVRGEIAQTETDDARALDRLSPLLSRFEDREETRNAQWYKLFVQVEATSGITNERMSRLTETLLRSLSIKRHIEKRLENCAFLHEHIPQNMRLYSSIGTEPLIGYPIHVKERDHLARALAERSIFCPVHWRSQAAPKSFTEEHALAQSLLTLPCDQRYDRNDMLRVTAEIIKLV